jgi:hypothetical protein
LRGSVRNLADRAGLRFSCGSYRPLEWAVRFSVCWRAGPFFGLDILCVARIGNGVFSARAHIWRRALSLSVLPLVTLVAIANAGTVWSLAIEAGERLHFQVMRRSYLEDVLKLPSVGEPRFAVWLWGGFVTGHGVVYDESDEIVMPEQSPAWKKRVVNTEVGSCGAWGLPLGNHFYLVRTGC